MGVNFKTSENSLIVEITGEIDHHFADEVKKSIDNQAISEGKRNIIFNLKNVDFMDSAGIGMIIGRYKLTTKNGGITSVACLSENLKRIMMISGLYRIIKIYNTVEEAEKSV